MKKNILVLALIVIIFQIRVVSAEFETDYNLELDFKQGEEYSIQTSFKQEIIQNLMGLRINASRTFKLEYEFMIKEVTEDDNYILAVEFINLELKQDNNDLPLKIGNLEDSNRLKQLMEELSKQKFFLTISKNGKLIAIDDPENLLTENVQDSVENFWGNIANYLPQKAVAVEDSWQNNLKLTEPLEITATSKYTLLKVEADAFIIDLNLDNADQISEIFKRTLIDEREIEFDFTNQQQGEIIINRENNWLNSLDFKYELKGDTKVSSGRNGQKFVIPMKIISQLEINSQRID